MLLHHDSDSFSINQSGYIGIGVNSASYYLDVQDSSTGLVTGTFASSAYFGVLNGTPYGVQTTGATSFNAVSAYIRGTLLAGRWIASVSDERIKRDIEDINDDEALQKLLLIEPKTYKYKDFVVRGEEKVYGFIAQQVKQVLPEAVKITKNFIPNIYKVFDLSGDTITTNEDLTNLLSVDDNIQIIDQEKESKESYKILEISPTTIKIDKTINGDKCFIFGKEVDDFHALSKEYIFTLNVCATQELYKLIQQQQQIINDLQNRILALENNI